MVESISSEGLDAKIDEEMLLRTSGQDKIVLQPVFTVLLLVVVMLLLLVSLFQTRALTKTNKLSV
jgi:hypothetical protein